MRVVGIDPGTGSFDFFGMDDDRVIVDATLPVPRVAAEPRVLLDTLEKLAPLDAVIGPSGYGLPVTPIRDMGERELDLMVPDDKSIPLYHGIRMVLRLMKQRGLPVYFTPGVIHLATVPGYRKTNRLDMGTADKVCCAALAIRDQAELLNIPPDETSFILAEIGFAFSAVMAVQDGRIVDGIGGTMGGPGFITLGGMDAELAARLGSFPGALLFTGGVRDASGDPTLTPERLAREPERYAAAWNMMLESLLKSIAAMTVAVERPREILLSGRLASIPELVDALRRRLARFGRVRRVNRRAAVAKEAAEGAFILGEGLLGGKNQPIVDAMQLRSAAGTMFDHILVKGVAVP